MSINLADLKVGQHARVIGYSKETNSKAYRQKLLAMGLTKGTEFSIVRVAPMGDPIEIRVRGFALSLRKEEANTLQAELISS